MNKVSVAAFVLGIASFAASGALYLTREKHTPPVINVHPAPVTVQQVPAPVVNVTPAPAPTPPPAAPPANIEPPKSVAPAPEISTGPKRKVTKITKKKSNAVKKLQTQWGK